MKIYYNNIKTRSCPFKIKTKQTKLGFIVKDNDHIVLIGSGYCSECNYNIKIHSNYVDCNNTKGIKLRLLNDQN